MRRLTSTNTILLFAIFIVLRISSAQTSSSTDLFRTGRIELILERRITDKDMPPDFKLQNPRGMAVDTKGNVYIADADAHDLKVFGSDGKFMRAIGRINLLIAWDMIGILWNSVRGPEFAS